MTEDFVIDCSGRKVPVGDKLFAAKCWKGNTLDFLAASSDFVSGQMIDWQPVRPISITVPIFRSGDSFIPTVASLYEQRWHDPDKVEIILYVNQPPGHLSDYTRESMQLANALSGATATPDTYQSLTNLIQAPGTPRLYTIQETIEGGLATLYRRAFVSLVARLFESVKRRQLATKDLEASALAALYDETFFTVVDDDLVFPDKCTFPDALAALSAGQSILLGDTQITSVQSSYEKLDSVLLNIMNLFLQFKYAADSVILPPRAASVSDLFHLQPPDPVVPYADQIWFAAGASGKERHYVPVLTTLQDEDYPSNAQMSATLAHYLATGESPEALNIFENVLASYSAGSNDKSMAYTQEDVSGLLELLRKRDIPILKQYTETLLKRGRQ